MSCRTPSEGLVRLPKPAIQIGSVGVITTFATPAFQGVGCGSAAIAGRELKVATNSSENAVRFRRGFMGFGFGDSEPATVALSGPRRRPPAERCGIFTRVRRRVSVHGDYDFPAGQPTANAGKPHPESTSHGAILETKTKPKTHNQ